MKKYIYYVLILLILEVNLVNSVVIYTESIFPLEYKTVYIGSYSFDISLSESQNLINPKNSTHITEFRVSSAGATATTIPISGKSILAILSAGTAQNMKFYALVSVENKTDCLNDTQNNTICTTRYFKTYAEDSFTAISLGARQSKQYAVSFETNNWVNGKFNLSFTSLISPTALVLDPSVSACGTISTNGTYLVTADLTTSGSPCITISTSNVVLDCQGHSVTVTSAGTTVLTDILVTNNSLTPAVTWWLNNVTVKNCILNGTNVNTHLLGYLVANSTFDNITIRDSLGTAGVNGHNIGTGQTCINDQGYGYAAYATWGISVLGSANLTISNIRVFNLTAGRGGYAGNNTVGAGCAAGNGGAMVGIYISNFLGNQSTNFTISNVNITNLTSGAGVTGGYGIGNGASGSRGGEIQGIWLTNGNAFNGSVTNVIINNLTSGVGGDGGKTTSACTKCPCTGLVQGSGGASGDAYGVLSQSGNTNMTFSSLMISNLTTTIGGNGQSGGNVRAGNGGSAGWAYGFYSGGTNLKAGNFSVLNLTGGNGGNAGAECNAAKWGGTGGWAFGFIESLGSTNLNNFTINNVSRGVQGTGPVNGGNGSGIAIYLNGVSSANYSNGTLANIDTHHIYDDYSGINNILLNITGFQNSKIFFDTDAGSDYLCSPCNFTVRWYARINATIPANINVSDNKTKIVYQGTGIALTPYFIVNDSVYNDVSGINPAVTWNNQTINTSSSGYYIGQMLWNFTFADITVNTTSYSFTISYPSLTTLCLTTATSKTQNCVACENQTSGTSFYTYTNTGNGNNDWNVTFTSGLPGCMTYLVKPGSDNCATATSVGTSVFQVYTGITPSQVKQAWGYMTFTSCTPVTDTRVLNSVGVG